MLRANRLASSIGTFSSNMMVIQIALHRKDIFVGNPRYCELLGALGGACMNYQPPSMPTEAQARALVDEDEPCPYDVCMVGDDLQDFGPLDTNADGMPRTQISGRLTKLSFLQLWQSQETLSGKIDFVDYRFASFWTLGQMVNQNVTFYATELAVCRFQGGRIPHYSVLVRTGSDLKARISHAGKGWWGSIRANYNNAIHESHSPNDDARNGISHSVRPISSAN